MVAPEELYNLFGERRSDLIRFATLQLRDPSLAEDVVQEALLAAVRGIGDFAGRSSVKTWVYSILKRKIIDALRTRHRETPISQLGNSAEDGEELDDLFDLVCGGCHNFRKHMAFLRSAARRWGE